MKPVFIEHAGRYVCDAQVTPSGEPQREGSASVVIEVECKYKIGQVCM